MRQGRTLAVVVSALALAAVPAVAPVRVHAAGLRDAMLTSVAWLAAHLHDPDLVILQVGTSYKEGHIPGAQAAEMSQFAAPSAPMPMTAPGAAAPLRLELPTDDQLRTTLENFGISSRSRIVIAESEDYYSPSTRIYLTLAHAGFGPRTSLLDGGLLAWKAAGQPLTTDIPDVTRTTIGPLPTVAVTVDSAYVLAHGHTPGTAILDVRSPAAWSGTEAVDPREQPQRFGHIPGARSLPLEPLWDDTRSALRPAAELERIFADAGVKPGDTVVAYCYVGQRATAVLFAAETLGHPVRLYDGSMDEWAKLKLPLEMPAKKNGGR